MLKPMNLKWQKSVGFIYVTESVCNPSEVLVFLCRLKELWITCRIEKRLGTKPGENGGGRLFWLGVLGAYHRWEVVILPNRGNTDIHGYNPLRVVGN